MNKTLEVFVALSRVPLTFAICVCSFVSTFTTRWKKTEPMMLTMSADADDDDDLRVFECVYV